MNWNPGKKKKALKNSISLSLCRRGRDGTRIGVDITAHPKKFGRMLRIAYPIKSDRGNSIVFDGGEYFKHYANVVNNVASLIDPETTQYTKVPLALRTMVAARKKRIQRLNMDQIHETLWNTLYPFQKEGVRAAIAKNYGKVLLCDDMGLGKSIQALTIAHYYRKQWPLLIICPSYLRHNWQHEVLKWQLVPPEAIQLVMSGKATPDPNAAVMIISYDLVSKFDLAPKIVICDESHFIKNRKAKRTKACLAILRESKRNILLTGTPALSRPNELFTQLTVIEPQAFGAFTQFATRYCDAHVGPFGWDCSGTSNVAELQVITQLCMIRRLKKDVLGDLPPKRREDIRLHVGSAVEALAAQFQELKDIRLRMAHTCAHSAQMDQNRAMTGLFRDTASVKKAAVVEYLSKYLDETSHKVIVFAHHVHVLDSIQQICTSKAIPHIRIDGTVPQKSRSALVSDFRKEARVAILSVKACGTGLNLTMCSHVIFAELCWNPGELLQAEDRTHRIGQKADSVFIQYLIGEGTFDENVWRMLNKKFASVSSFLNDENKLGFASMTCVPDAKRKKVM